MDVSFELLGDRMPASPVVLSVPHAGRDYPRPLLAALRLPVAALTVLEDRHIDAVALSARRHETALIQRRARAWIDLNRAESERDPKVEDGVSAQTGRAPSAKLRSGLGLVPRRAGAAGDLWRHRFTAADVADRIARDYRPFHDALATALAAARARFGIAVLIDLHSMPALREPARIVLGDRHGRSAAARFVRRLHGEAASAGIATALNTPYAGGHIVQRHAAPERGIHAIQVEIDRTLYLDSRLDEPGPGLLRTAALVQRMLAAIEDEAIGHGHAVAAE